MVYDLIIIGQGPAGLSAGIYASRYNLSTLIIGEEPGGTATHAYKIENYPGFKSISGMELMNRFRDQIDGLVEIKNEKVVEVKKKDDFVVKTELSEYLSRAVIFAAGTKRRRLNIPGESEFLGRGVSYCAICDASFFKDKVVGVAGGNDSAVISAMLLSEHAKKVYIIYRKEKIRAEPANLKQVEKNEKIEIINNANILEIKGDKIMQSVKLDRNYNESNELKIDGIFIEIGSVPCTELTKSIEIEHDEKGYIKVDEKQQTSLEGMYAAGDVTNASNNLWQIITAASEGAIAANSVYNFLKSKNGNV